MTTGNPRSTAQIAGHPLHPMLIPFPIALLTATLVCDLVYAVSGTAGWATAALWLLGAAILSAVAAAVAGVLDFAGDARIRRVSDAWHHFIGNAIVILLALANFIYRLMAGEAAVLPWGLVLSLLIMALLAFTGWKGGELVYRHRVGVMDEVAADPALHGRQGRH